jgi:hypothetical protein
MNGRAARSSCRRSIERGVVYQGETLVMIGTALLAGEQDGPVMQHARAAGTAS